MDERTEAHILTESCAAYLLHFSNTVRDVVPNAEKELQTHRRRPLLNKEFPFLRYATLNWPDYATLCDVPFTSLILRLLTSAQYRHDWAMYWHSKDQFAITTEPAVGTALYYASYLGLSSIVATLLRDGADVNEAVNHRGTPLSAAASNGSTRVVGMLLEAGARVNGMATDKYGGVEIALVSACFGGHAEVVGMLIDAGARVDKGSGTVGTALRAAITGGSADVVRMLLKAGADPDLCVGFYGTPLQIACERSKIEFARMLLDAGAKIDLTSTLEFRTPLALAVRQAHYASTYRAPRYVEVMKLLLDRGANPNLCFPGLELALQLWKEGQHDTVINMLIKRADPMPGAKHSIEESPPSDGWDDADATDGEAASE